ncbi:MAG: hypothetical protein LH609_16700, partial [Rudanella sp.]|nr:hypothetical protein [Rudanella sp.]
DNAYKLQQQAIQTEERRNREDAVERASKKATASEESAKRLQLAEQTAYALQAKADLALRQKRELEEILRQANVQVEQKAQKLEAQKQQEAQARRLAEESRIALLKQQQEGGQRNFCETGTSYCFDIQRLYERNPTNFKFPTIRSLTKDCGVHHELKNGVKQLDTYDQLSHYIFAYGLMHQAKLQQAYESIFSNNHLQLTGQRIEIIDYGCGQGIGTICFIDYLKEQTNCNCTITRVKLVEPSVLALKRAVLNISYSLKSINNQENILAINKELNGINQQDIETQNTTTKIHIFSNIIDVEGFDLYQLYHKILATQSAINIFICVSPNIMPSRNQRLDRFQQYFMNHPSFTPIDNRESDIPNPKSPDKSYKRYERLFKVQLGDAIIATNPVILSHSSRFTEDDDLPF